MPVAIQADWPLIQTLYVQGTSAKELEARFGVPASAISTRASRANWRRLATTAKESLTEAVQDALEGASKRVRNTLATALVAHVSKLKKPKTWKEAAKVNQELEPLVRNAKTVFGWNDQGQSSLVRISIMGNATIQGEESILIPQGTQGIEGGRPLLPGGASSLQPLSEFSKIEDSKIQSSIPVIDVPPLQSPVPTTERDEDSFIASDI